MVIDIPYLSQHAAATDPYWKLRACAIVCVKLTGDFMRPGSMPSVDELIHEGNLIKGFDPEPGWRHLSLVMLLHNHGVLAYNQEYRSADAKTLPTYTSSVYTNAFTQAAITKVVSELKNNRPVITTVPGKLNVPGQVHMILLTGFEQENDSLTGFYYHNPDTMSEAEGRHCFVGINDFIQRWRRFCIFMES